MDRRSARPRPPTSVSVIWISCITLLIFLDVGLADTSHIIPRRRRHRVGVLGGNDYYDEGGGGGTSSRPRCKLWDEWMERAKRSVLSPADNNLFFNADVRDADKTRYEVKSWIGQGFQADGIVTAVDHSTGEEVAIKKYTNITEDASTAGGIFKEVSIHRRLTSLGAGVVKLKRVLVPKDAKSYSSLYLVVELMDGDLAKAHDAISEMDTRLHKLMAYQLLSAVHDIHRAGYIHGDLKSANVFLRHDCTVKLGDFGYARPIVFKDYGQYIGEKRMTLPMPMYYIWHGGFLPGADIWHAGRELLDMISGKHLFYEDVNFTTADLIVAWWREYGAPPAEMLPYFDEQVTAIVQKNLSSASTASLMNRWRTIDDLFPGIPSDVLRFAKRLLNWDIPNSPPASVLLRDPFFDEVRSDPLLQKLEHDALRIERKHSTGVKWHKGNWRSAFRKKLFSEISEAYPEAEAASKG